MANGKFASSGVVVGQTPGSKWEKQLQNLKSNSVTMGHNVPSQTEGAIGDITVREVATLGLRCYIKTNGGWVDINTMKGTDVSTWTPMTLINNWEHHSSAYHVPGYFKDIDGFVHLRGGIKNSVSARDGDENIVTLPVGFRPVINQYRFAVVSDNPPSSLEFTWSAPVPTALALIKIATSGVILVTDCAAYGQANSESVNAVCLDLTILDGITFHSPQIITQTGGGASSCVLPGTKIITKRGEINIEHTNEDDLIKIFNFKTKEFGWSPIQSILNTTVGDGWSEVKTKKGRTLKCSNTHLLYHPDYSKSAISADSLGVGGQLFVVEDGEIVPDIIKSIKVHNEPVEVWNYELEITHNFISNGILSHNALSKTPPV